VLLTAQTWEETHVKKIFKVKPGGNVEGLHDDLLVGLGKTEITRASRVEFCEDAQRWTVEILIGNFAGCFLAKAFPTRREALNEEVKFLNKELFGVC
jgi:hypothetical protein